MELNALEDEQKALLSEKTGELEYIQSLQDRINVLKVFILMVPLLAYSFVVLLLSIDLLHYEH